MASPRSRELSARLDQLRRWGVRESLACWRTVDPDQILPSFTAATPALIDIHQALCIEALTAVDLFMFLAAADAGWRYQPDWTKDHADRPGLTYWGQSIKAALGATPLLVLRRIKEGDSVDVAMLRGWHNLARIYDTEAHQIGRTVVLSRVQADLARRGL